jgi:hypothetical protein
MVRKLHARLEVTSSNPRTRARVYFTRKSRDLWLGMCACVRASRGFQIFFWRWHENHVTCDLGHARVWGPLGGFQIFFDVGVPPLVPVRSPRTKRPPFCLSSLVPIRLERPIPLSNRDWRSSLYQWHEGACPNESFLSPHHNSQPVHTILNIGQDS